MSTQGHPYGLGNSYEMLNAVIAQWLKHWTTGLLGCELRALNLQLLSCGQMP